MTKKQITAYICDRCGKICRGDEWRKMKQVKRPIEEFWQVNDLCPECYGDFCLFMGGAKVVRDDN